MVLFCIFAVRVVGSILPLALTNPAWQLRLTTVLVGNGFLALLGICLFHLWAVLPYEYSRTRRRWLDAGLKIRRLAVLATFGFLMLLPLQGLAGWELIRTNFSAASQGSSPSLAEQRFKAMEQAIRESADAITIQNRLAILRGPAIAPQDMKRPLPQLKIMLLQALERARQGVGLQSQQQASMQRWTLIQECVQNSLISLAYAAGFAAFAQRPQPRRIQPGVPSNPSLLDEFLHWIRPRTKTSAQHKQLVQELYRGQDKPE